MAAVDSFDTKKKVFFFFFQLEGEGLARACTRLRNETSVTQPRTGTEQPIGGDKVPEIQLRLQNAPFSLPCKTQIER